MGMTRRALFLALLLALLPWMGAVGQHAVGYIRKGNRAYKKQEYKAAELEYRKSLDSDSTSIKAQYNLAAALYKQERYDEAGKRYEGVAQEQGMGAQVGRDALYNAANALFKERKYDKSAELYKQLLRENPRDEEARYNLSEALRRLEKQEQEKQNQGDSDQQQNQGNNDQGQRQNNQDQQQGQSNKDQQNQGDGQQKQQGDQDKRDGQNGGTQPENQEEKQQGDARGEHQGQQQERMDAADAKRILQALEKQQGKAAEKVRRAAEKGGKPRRNTKDW